MAAVSGLARWDDSQVSWVGFVEGPVLLGTLAQSLLGLVGAPVGSWSASHSGPLERAHVVLVCEESGASEQIHHVL